MKKLALVNGDHIAKAFLNYFRDKDVEIILFDTPDKVIGDFDLILFYNYQGKIPKNGVNLHPSLLPAFDCEDALREAFLAGVKVSGITVVYHGKILAQYPVLIGTSTHFDEFEKEIHNLENLLYPIVIDKILKDEVFDFSDLIGGCEGCRGCH